MSREEIYAALNLYTKKKMDDFLLAYRFSHAYCAQKLMNYLNWLNIKVVKCFVHTQ